jgi:hypothetical protein
MKIKKIDIKSLEEITEQNEQEIMKINETKLNQIKARTYDLLSISSISFLLRIYQTKNIILQLIWIIFILGSFGFSVYYFITNIQNYLAFNVNSSIKQVFENQPEFPSISICSENNRTLEIDILFIRFNSKNLTKETDLLEYYYDPFYKFCYRFNGGNLIPIQKSNYAGYKNGFQIDFNYETGLDYGQLLVNILNQSMAPPTLYGNGYYISSGCYYYFSVKKTIAKKLPAPYNDCFDDVSLFPLNKTLINYILNKNMSYTQNECINYCLSLKYNETNKCNCSLETLDDLWTKCYNYAETEEISDCTFNFTEEFASGNQYELCSEYCPLECNSFTFQISQTIQPIIVNGNLSSDFLYPKFKTAENFSKNFFSINVYYEELKYTLISESPQMELFGLISSIGGTFSLFLGLSFICLVDVLHIIWENILILVSNKR